MLMGDLNDFDPLLPDSSSNVPRACTSSFGRMLRKVSSFERKKPKPPSLSSGSQSARGRASSGALAGGAQCD